MLPSKIPRELLVLLGRVNDSDLSVQFNIPAKVIANIRAKLGMPERKTKHTSAFVFVREWQAAKTTREVAMRTGISIQYVAIRANAMRKKGVRLKDLDAGGSEFWELIRKLAEETNVGNGLAESLDAGDSQSSRQSARPGDSGHAENIDFSGSPETQGLRSASIPSDGLSAMDTRGIAATGHAPRRRGRPHGKSKKEGHAIDAPSNGEAARTDAE